MLFVSILCERIWGRPFWAYFDLKNGYKAPLVHTIFKNFAKNLTFCMCKLLEL